MDKKGNLYICVCEYIFNILFRGMRSGTVPHTLVVGLGAACDIANQEMKVHIMESERVLTSRFFT